MADVYSRNPGDSTSGDPEPDAHLAHRIEEASMNAWPAMQQILLDGWVLRFSKGFTRRSNSIVPVYPAYREESDESLLDKIRYCENLYAREQLQTVFRLTSISDRKTRQLDNLLESRGYELREPCHVLTCNLSQLSASQSEITLVTLEQWLQAYCYLTGMGEPASTLHQLILKGIAGECAFAVLTDGENPIACGLGVLEHELVGLFDIYTHPQRRRSGLGRTIVEGLLRWGREHDATRGYLQVVSDNLPARRLYNELDFVHSHEYWYRIAP